MISVVIPTFNEQKNGRLEVILKSLNNLNSLEIICVNKPGAVSTKNLFEKFDVKVIESEKNSRAARLNLGIKAAKYDMILLHHPRSVLDRKGVEKLLSLADDKIWGAFTHCFDDPHLLLKFTSWYSNKIRGKVKKIFYLDHCIFFHRQLLPNGQLIPEVDIFEDTKFCEILNQQMPPILLSNISMTSAIRFKENGYLKQSILNQILKLGYHLNLSDKLMNAIYEKGLYLNSTYKDKSSR